MAYFLNLLLKEAESNLSHFLIHAKLLKNPFRRQSKYIMHNVVQKSRKLPEIFETFHTENLKKQMKEHLTAFVILYINLNMKKLMILS